MNVIGDRTCGLCGRDPHDWWYHNNQALARIRELEAELKEASDSAVAAGMYETLTAENARLQAERDEFEKEWESANTEVARLRADLAEARAALRWIGSDCCTHAVCRSKEHRKARAALSHQGEPFGPCCDHHADDFGHLVSDAETRLARIRELEAGLEVAQEALRLQMDVAARLRAEVEQMRVSERPKWLRRHGAWRRFYHLFGFHRWHRMGPIPPDNETWDKCWWCGATRDA